MKVVVTGGSGQLGTLVLTRLEGRDDIEKIVSLDLVPPMVASSRIDWRIADLRDPGLERHLEGADALVHLAFIVTRSASIETMRAVNVEGSRRIFEAAAQHGVRRIVYASSVAAYGISREHPPLIVESTPRRPSPALTYADNKYEVEVALDAFEVTHPEVAVVRLRPGVLLGRRMSLIAPSFVRRRVLPVFGDARAPIVWDEDVADAIVLALRDGVHGAFNLVAEAPIASEEFAALAGFRAVHVPRGAASAVSRASAVLGPLLGEKRIDAGWLDAAEIDFCVACDAAKKELGWQPKYVTSADVAKAFGERAPRGTDRRVAWFFSAIGRVAQGVADRGELGDTGDVKRVLHIEVTGPTGGDFALIVDQGKAELRHGIVRPPTSTVSLDVETLLELLAGRGPVASAVLSGSLRVRGEPTGLRLFTGIVEGFRRLTSAKGVRGNIARRFSSWFEQTARR
jgi:nucleoside-diphosphate-sugar epimerase/putative sterol carrier protein